MGRVIYMGVCPSCGGGANTPCFAKYADGHTYCFSCHVRTKSNILDFSAHIPLKSTPTVVIPTGTSSSIKEFSPQVLDWLYNNFVFDNLIKKYKISFVKDYSMYKEDSLLFPVLENSKLQFYQRRFFPNKKFITRGYTKLGMLIKNKDSNKLIIVEDYISAIRAGEFVNVLCLFGTNLTEEMLKKTRKLDMDIKLYLDPDEAGQEAGKIIFKKLDEEYTSKFNSKAFAIREPRTISLEKTEKQLKEYCDEELKQILEI